MWEGDITAGRHGALLWQRLNYSKVVGHRWGALTARISGWDTSKKCPCGTEPERAGIPLIIELTEELRAKIYQGFEGL